MPGIPSIENTNGLYHKNTASFAFQQSISSSTQRREKRGDEKTKMAVQSVVPAADINFNKFLTVFNSAYSDYFVPLQMEKDTMQRLIERDAIDMTASRVALEDNEVVGVGMLAMRGKEGWIGGLGIIPSHRRRGIGRMLTQNLLDTARQWGLAQVRLEVIERNIAARTLYLDLGFEKVRRLLLLERKADEHDTTTTGIDSTYHIETVASDEALLHFEALHFSPNPWQRHHEALKMLADSMDAWIAVRDETVKAYAVGWAIESITRLMDIAGDVNAVRPLLMYIQTINPGAPTGIVNLPDDEPIAALMQEMNYEITETQWEMVYRF